VALGQFQLDPPEQLLRLLVTMGRNKVATQARRPQVRLQDHRGLAPADDPSAGPVAADPGPSEHATGRDLLEAFRRRLTPEERALADGRATGREWADLAAERGESPEALRKRLARALDRVARELGLDEMDHDVR
jgi:DNA-directed RNA polymerase specialized sigma24 family protein